MIGKNRIGYRHEQTCRAVGACGRANLVVYHLYALVRPANIQHRLYKVREVIVGGIDAFPRC